MRLRDNRVFEDPRKMKLYRLMTAWKMYIQDRLRRETVLDRYLLFKRRMLTLRSFLGWRSIAKYEHSSGNSTAYQNSRGTTGSVMLLNRE